MLLFLANSDENILNQHYKLKTLEMVVVQGTSYSGHVKAREGSNFPKSPKRPKSSEHGTTCADFVSLTN